MSSSSTNVLMPRSVRGQFRVPPLVWVSIAFTLLGVVMTWPLASPDLGLPNADDSYFSVWRLAWVAHQLSNDPRHLFDANIFHPAKGTLAFSDAMLGLGLVSAPFIWAGVHPMLMHNILLIGAFVSSAVAAYMLCFSITKDRMASAMGGIVFGFAPYRFAHTAHLELQWTTWMPLALLAIHRIATRPSVGAGIALGSAMALQFLCSLYHGVFLTAYASVAWCLLAVARRLNAAAVRATALALLVMAVVLTLYLVPYMGTRVAHGSRADEEVARYSATPGDYLRVPPMNRLLGNDRPSIAPDERSLFPGIAALVLSLAAFWPPIRRHAVFYLVLLVFAVDASLGINGLSFNLLRWIAPPLGSLRAPARFGALVLLSLSVLASIGAARARRSIGGVKGTVCLILVASFCIVEYWSAPHLVRRPPIRPQPVYQWLATQPPDTVILELPLPNPAVLWLYETTYSYNSIFHWRRMVNGYSAFAPPAYLQMLEWMKSFPDSRSVRRLRRIGVDYILLHRGYFGSNQYRDADRHDAGSWRVRDAFDFWPRRRRGLGFPDRTAGDCARRDRVSPAVTLCGRELPLAPGLPARVRCSQRRIAQSFLFGSVDACHLGRDAVLLPGRGRRRRF